jgi:CheY-like chemotaxis protein
MCILIVDDDEDVRLSLADLIERAGYALAQAEDGADALALLRQIPPPCLMLLDVEMPEIDGPELAARVRADAAFAGTTIVFVTATPARAPAGYRVLQKPPRLGELWSLLAEHAAGCA